ncbi:MAG: hypothetical protein JWM91_3136, partial [Rhodospirillales bacterium]|nr:hypothetical protein [Rhodospirillales bacterium]
MKARAPGSGRVEMREPLSLMRDLKDSRLGMPRGADSVHGKKPAVLAALIGCPSHRGSGLSNRTRMIRRCRSKEALHEVGQQLRLFFPRESICAPAPETLRINAYSD